MTIRLATPADVPEILSMIRELAEYERALVEVVATVEQLTAALFGGTEQSPGIEPITHHGGPAAMCHVAELPTPDSEGRTLAGMALWFLNFSTWKGRHGIYLEDLYVRPHLRGHGYGRALLATLAATAAAHGYGRVEWWVLDWNSPAVGFYESIGAIPMDEWTVHRLSGDALAELAATAPAPSRKSEPRTR